ncbi:MAG: alkyl hydroperoxide reductase [Microbacteriaceae bacterium]|nr:alkyl hydroperoxide reductase [Microbacteriaceae bacterium]
MNLRVALIAGVVGASLLLAGCSTDQLATDYGSGGVTDYSDDSGAPVLVAPKDRASALDFSSTADDGTPLKLADYRGKVVVVNFWYASCAPCRAEAPILESLHQKYLDKGVSFIGVNTSDQADTAISFEKNYKITYPSVIDVDSGTARIAFSGAVAASAVPTTFVLDKKGRIAARIIGQLESPSILNTLVTDTLAEKN